VLRRKLAASGLKFAAGVRTSFALGKPSCGTQLKSLLQEFALAFH